MNAEYLSYLRQRVTLNAEHGSAPQLTHTEVENLFGLCDLALAPPSTEMQRLKSELEEAQLACKKAEAQNIHLRSCIRTIRKALPVEDAA